MIVKLWNLVDRPRAFRRKWRVLTEIREQYYLNLFVETHPVNEVKHRE